MHGCMWFKQNQIWRKKTLEDLTQKKTKKFRLKGIKRDQRGRQKSEEQCSDSFYFLFKKMIFDQSRGIEPGIENVLKTGSTNRKELKNESSLAKSFSLKNWIFWSIKNRFDWSKPEKSENFENLEIFYRNTFKPVFMIWNACQWFQMFPKTLSLQSNQFWSRFKIFYPNPKKY